MRELKQVMVCPTRLARGEWSQRFNKTVGEGDISAAYSADRIGMGKAIRRPFIHAGERWVSVGASQAGSEAYRLTTTDAFNGVITTYAERSNNSENARSDPMGYYHGMRVQYAGHDHVLCGPPVIFIPGEIKQPSLF